MALSTQSVIASLMEKFSNDDGEIVGLTQDELVRAFQQVDTKPSGKMRKTKKAKDPNAPKRASTAYMLWLNENRATIAEDHCSHLEGRDKTTGITKKAGELWKALSDEDKAPYQEKYVELKANYDAEMAIYAPKAPAGPKYDASEFPSAPENWHGPYLDTFLRKHVKGADGKNLKFKTFDEAVEMVNSLDDSVCAGITKTARFYELRIGPNIIPQSSRNTTGLGTWVRGIPIFEGEAIEVNVDRFAESSTDEQPNVSESSEVESAPAPEKPKIVKKKMVKKIKKTGEEAEAKAKAKAEAEAKAKAEAEAKAKAEAEAKVKAEAEAKAKAEAEAKAKTEAELKAKTSEQEIFDEQTDNEDDEDGEGVDAEEIDIGGTTYFMTGDGEIYNGDYEQVGEKPDDADENAEPCADWLW